MDISVIIPTRNRSQKLLRTLDGLRAQSISSDEFEVVVVDNGSSDDTCAAVTQFLGRASRPRWKLLRESKPGAAAARNSGIRASQGEIVLFLDDDVVADPQLIAEHRASQEQRPAMVLGLVRFPWNGSEDVFRRTLCEHPELLQSFHFPDPNDVPFRYFYTCNLSLPRAFLSRIGGFDEDFRASGFEDTDLGYRLWQAGYRMVFNPRACGLHDCRQPFSEFAEKQRRNGHELRGLLKKHPELREVFLPAADSRRRKIANTAGAAAALLTPLFEGAAWFVSPVMARLCWLNLQHQFWAGFGETD